MFHFCPVLHVQKQLSENVFIDERRPVLLCDGKLCLRALQELFNLTIVEMMHGTPSYADQLLPFSQNFSCCIKVVFWNLITRIELSYRARLRNTSLHCSPVSCSRAIIRSD